MRKVALVCMPWYELSFPSIQCEILHEVLIQNKIDTDIIHGYLLWGEYILTNCPNHQEDMFLFIRNICLKYGYVGLGEWIFSEKINENNTENEYLEYLIKNTGFVEVLGDNIDFNSFKSDILMLRMLATDFIEKLGEKIISKKYDIVAFSTTLNQNLASLSLAKYLKEKNKNIKIIFGGSNCDGEQGKQLIKSFEFIDYILSGEGELIGAPDSVRTFRVELLIKDVEKLIAKIRISGCSSPRLNPLSFDAHFTHVFTNSAFSNGFAGFTKFPGYFRGAVILFRIIIDGLDFLFHSFLALLGSRDCSVKKRTISRARHT